VGVPRTAIEFGYVVVWRAPADASGTPNSAARTAAISKLLIVDLLSSVMFERPVSHGAR
jgi:hypothetical protein